MSSALNDCALMVGVSKIKSGSNKTVITRFFFLNNFFLDVQFRENYSADYFNCKRTSEAGVWIFAIIVMAFPPSIHK